MIKMIKMIKTIKMIKDDQDDQGDQAQLFQSFFFLLLRTLQLIDWICLGANSSEMHNKVGRYRWGYHYNRFPTYTGWTQEEEEEIIYSRDTSLNYLH